MDQSKILIKNQSIGSVFKCHGGINHVNLLGMSLHFEEFAFLSFAGMVQDAASKLMDDGLRTLLDDTKL